MFTEEAIERLKALQQDNGFPTAGELFARLEKDEELRNEIRYLTKIFIKREIGNCSSCLMDSYVILKKLDIKKAMLQETSKFALKAGVVLCQGAPQDKWMTRMNVTDALAIYWIKKDPSCLKYFSKVPENLNELLEPKKEHSKKQTETK